MLVPMLTAMDQADLTVEAVIIDGELGERDKRLVAARLDPSYEQIQPDRFHFPKTPFYFVRHHEDPQCLELIKGLTSPYILNAGTPRILKNPMLQLKRGVLNAHPGLLPGYRGCTCVEWAIYHSDPVGATVHFMSLGIDEGPIVMSEIMDIPPWQSYETIRTRMLEFSARLMARAVAYCLDEDLLPEYLEPQSEGCYHKPIDFESLIEVKRKLAAGEYASCPSCNPNH